MASEVALSALQRLDKAGEILAYQLDRVVEQRLSSCRADSQSLAIAQHAVTERNGSVHEAHDMQWYADEGTEHLGEGVSVTMSSSGTRCDDDHTKTHSTLGRVLVRAADVLQRTIDS